MLNKIKLLTLAAVATVATPVLAAPPDLTSMTAAVDFSTVTTALLSVGAAIIVVYIAWKGAKMLISAVKGA
mgnify:CR=1 FL=1